MTNSQQGNDENEADGAQRQPDRDREEVRDRDDENEAMAGDPDNRLGELDDALETHEYPTTTDELVAAYGDHEVETQDGTKALEDVLAATDDQTFVSADDVRSRILGLIHR